RYQPSRERVLFFKYYRQSRLYCQKKNYTPITSLKKIAAMGVRLRKYAILLLIGFISCKHGKYDINPSDGIAIPEGFPAIPYPKDNAYSYERWALGKKLFYDTRLSLNNNLSCASCHLPSRAFSDTVAFSKGDGQRLASTNSPTLTNVAYHPYYTRSGAVPTLEMHIAVPVQEHNEFNNNIVDIVNLLSKDEEIQHRSMESYNRPFDAFVFTRAIANFARSFISGESRYDKFGKGGVNENWTAAEQRGKELFFSSKTHCSNCHKGFDFTNYKFANNGLYTNYADSGRMRFTKDEADRALFKIPTLRNIALTAPYMHDGSIKTLEAVVEHYNKGGAAHK